MTIKSFLKKNGVNVLLVVLIFLLLFPATSMPIRVQLNRLFSFSPSMTDPDKQLILTNYNWTLNSLQEGVESNLLDSKGKVILINFWATWCPPCVAEMPSLQQLYNEFKGQVDFYFVSQESPEKLKKFMNKKGYTFPVKIYKTPPPEVFSVTSIPATFVISKEKKIVISKVGAANWASPSIKKILRALL